MSLDTNNTNEFTKGAITIVRILIPEFSTVDDVVSEAPSDVGYKAFFSRS